MTIDTSSGRVESESATDVGKVSLACRHRILEREGIPMFLALQEARPWHTLLVPDIAGRANGTSPATMFDHVRQAVAELPPKRRLVEPDEDETAENPTGPGRLTDVPVETGDQYPWDSTRGHDVGGLREHPDHDLPARRVRRRIVPACRQLAQYFVESAGCAPRRAGYCGLVLPTASTFVDRPELRPAPHRVDRERARAGALAVTWDGLERISRYRVIGSYTANHAAAANVVMAADVEREVLEPVRLIEQVTGKHPPAFAWLHETPFDPDSAAGPVMLQAGIRSAVSKTAVQRIND